ncbi:MAG: response regulator [Syntrophales bacterium]|nr:response regulator [Syntrophales bacterium]
METKYLTVLADCCQRIFSEMTRTEVVNVSIKKDERFQEIYAVAQVAPYEDFPQKVSGIFFLGFTDEHLAVAVASAIAENLGFPPLSQFDDRARDALNEMVNTTMGHVVTRWDKMGFRVRFKPPVSAKNVNIKDPAFASQEAYRITLDLGGERVVFTVTFTDADRQQCRRRILVVDDSGIIRALLAKYLIEAGFAVEVAEDGAAALDKYQGFRPHLTIMDLNMPRMGGLEAIQEISLSDPQARFIVLTSTARRDEEMIARTQNVLAYVLKPVKIHEFLLLIREALG